MRKCRPFQSVQFFLFCLATVQLGQFLTGSYLRSCLSTMERLYGFNSKKTGLLVSGGDVGTLCVILFVSYLGRKVHRPRFIAISAIFMSASVCLFGMLYFIAAPSSEAIHRAISRSGAHSQTHQSRDAPLCTKGSGVGDQGFNSTSKFAYGSDDATHDATHEATDADTEEANNSLYVLMFLTLMLFGVGIAPVNPLGVSYMDDAADPNRAPLYVALLFALTIVGPAFGHLIAAKALTISTPTKGPMWNIGFFIGAATMLFAQISLWFFPREMPKQKNVKEKVLVKRELELNGGAVNPAFDAGEGGGAKISTGYNGVKLTSSSALSSLFSSSSSSPAPIGDIIKDGKVDKDQESSTCQQFEKRQKTTEGKKEEEEEEEKSPENLEEDLRDMSFVQYVKGFYSASKEIVQEPIWCLMTAMTVLLTAMIGGVISFQTKYLEIQYGVSAGRASLLLGTVNIPVGIVGIIAGGFVMKKRAYTLFQASLHCLVFFSIATLITVTTLFLGCPTRSMVGINEYQADSSRIEYVSKCNIDCHCSIHDYAPICTKDNIEYLSPCLAGCRKHNSTMDSYSDCDCIPLQEAQAGKCQHRCPHYVTYYMIVNSLAFLVSGLVHSPGYIIFLRSVKPKHKSLAIGLQYLFVRAIGKFPSPILFGAVVDSTCLLWSNEKEKGGGGGLGSCLVYDSDALRARFWGVALILDGLILLIFIAINYILWKREKDGKETEMRRK